MISLFDMNALCDSDTNFGMIFFRRLAIVLDTILYKTLHRLIGRKSRHTIRKRKDESLQEKRAIVAGQNRR